jgi:branched-chain amino acid transport system permease protein
MHAGYMGIAAYTVGLYLKFVDPSASLWLVMALGIAVTAVIAFPIGWLQVRTGGFAFALLSIAFGMMYYTVVWKARNVTGGDDGLMGLRIPKVTLGPWALGSASDPTTMYLLTLVVVLVCFLITWRIIHSPFGAVLESIRENEERAAFIGINAHRYKLGGWMLACSLAGVSGVLLTLLKAFVSPTIMDANAGGGVLMMTLLGGVGTLWGPFIGAGVFILVHDYVSAFTEHWMIFLGGIVVLLVLFMPKGVAGLKDYVPALAGRKTW